MRACMCIRMEPHAASIAVTSSIPGDAPEALRGKRRPTAIHRHGADGNARVPAVENQIQLLPTPAVDTQLGFTHRPRTHEPFFKPRSHPSRGLFFLSRLPRGYWVLSSAMLHLPHASDK